MLQNSSPFKGAIRTFLTSTFLVSYSSLLPSLVSAQETPVETTPEDQIIEELIVTGSRIKRRDFNSVSPIVSISAEDLDLRGITNVEDILNTMPQIQPSFNRTANNPGNGTATLNLRNVGVNRTLVLLNGRRMAPAGVSGAVDVNQIPSALIERVEIVSGGASSVYGSDAVGGAINFIMKKSFKGIQADVGYQLYEAGDGGVIDANLTFGKTFGDGAGNLMIYYGFQDRQSILMETRDFTRDAMSDDPITGEFFQGGSFFRPNGAVFFPPALIDEVFITDGITFDDDGTPRAFIDPDDLYNYAGPNYLQVPLRRNTAGLFTNYKSRMR